VLAVPVQVSAAACTPSVVAQSTAKAKAGQTCHTCRDFKKLAEVEVMRVINRHVFIESLAV